MQLPSEARSHWICWDWSYSHCELPCRCWRWHSNLSPLGEQLRLITTKPPLQPPGHHTLSWTFPLPDDSQRALHTLPNMISWRVIFSWINPVTFLRKNVLSLALWEKYLINALPKIFRLAEWAGRASGLIKEKLAHQSKPGLNKHASQSPRPVNVARNIHIDLMQSFAAAPALGCLDLWMQVGLPRKQAGLFQISLPPNCCTDWFWENHFVILNLPFPHL